MAYDGIVPFVAFWIGGGVGVFLLELAVDFVAKVVGKMNIFSDEKLIFLRRNISSH